MSRLNLPSCSFEPFPTIPSLDTREKSSAPPFLLPLLSVLVSAGIIFLLVATVVWI